jgi:hypothetical protein
VATVGLSQFTIYDPNNPMPLGPGQARDFWSEWNWSGNSASITAQPFDAWGQNRELSVTRFGMRSYGSADPNGPPKKYLTFTVTNTAADTVVIYYIQIVTFTP